MQDGSNGSGEMLSGQRGVESERARMYVEMTNPNGNYMPGQAFNS